MDQLDKVVMMYIQLREQLGVETLLDDLFQAMDCDELEENFEHIAKARDIEFEF